MTKYSGSWAKGFASAFDPVGAINLGLQWKERKKAQKRIDDAVEQLKLNSTTLASKFDSARADGSITQQEYSDAVVWALPLGDEIMGRVEKLYGNYRQFTQEQINKELEEINAFYELSADLDFSNIEEMKLFKSNLTQENAKTKWDLMIKSIESRQAQPTAEVFTTAEEVKKAYPGAGYEYSTTAKGYIPTFQKPTTPTMANEKSAVSILRLFVNASPETFEKKRMDLERTGLDLSLYTQDVLKEAGTELYNLYDTPEAVLTRVKAPAGLIVVPSRDSKTGKYYASFQKKAVTPTPGGRVTSLPLQESYKQKALDANTWTDAQGVVDTYAKAGYDTSEMPTEQEWIDAKLGELDSHVAMFKEITDEEGRLLGDKKFNFMSGDSAESKTGEQWYKEIYEAYMFYLKELRKMGIDVSKYLRIKSPKEVSKVGFLKGMFTGGGVERGYPSIYYTGITPTPTETPKLPSL